MGAVFAMRDVAVVQLQQSQQKVSRVKDDGGRRYSGQPGVRLDSVGLP